MKSRQPQRDSFGRTEREKQDPPWRTTVSRIIAEGSVPELDTIAIDLSQGALFFDSPADLAKHQATFSRLDSTALSEESSREFIRSIMKEVEAANA
ncbi:Scr1 family TA system antitoxin-like transcriptional regulator [Kitasatospora sp. NPDC087315]|uniref:Scr1 family TA system antitoxin-like transcriptional regulator n=1 Tax=Kitasatospora sp. NPDC087315 TaxID=3364069 RepID=UPI0037FC646F